MEQLSLWLLKSAIWITGFAVVYLCFLKNERFFLLNRIYLLGGILVSLLFPFLTIRYIVEVPSMPYGFTGTAGESSHAGAASGFSTPAIILAAVWISGTLFVIVRYLAQVIPLISALNRSEKEIIGPVKLIRSAECKTPFSFFSFVLVNPSTSEKETREILNHETVHVRQKHWLDLLLSGMLCIVQWFNPVVWIYSRLIRQNHEYLADEGALQRTSDPALYRAALLNQIAGSPVVDLGNFFNFSLNKKRFTMMKNKISSPYRKLKLLLILPVMALVLYAFARPEYRIVDSSALPDPEVAVSARQDMVKGLVTDQNGHPLQGAAVVVRGTTVGTITDADGRFALRDIDKDAVLVVSFVGFETQAVKPSFGPEMNVKMLKETIVTDTVTVSPMPPPPPPPPAVFSSLEKALVIIDGAVSNKPVSEIPPDEIAEVRVLKDEAAIKAYGSEGKNGVIEIITKKNVPKDDTFVIVEEMPQFPGGNEAMMSWIMNNIKYPAEAVRDKITGMVIVAFIVDKNGKVRDVKVDRSVSQSIDAEAIRVISSMPDWQPGKQKGKPVDVQYKVPVRFSL